jgi:Holliday junction resolvase RusA-like endonuclease
MELRLPFPVSVNDMYINNKGRTGRGRKPSPEYLAWKDHAGWELKAQKPKPIEGRVEITIDLDESRRGDADNRIKPVLDLLVQHGVLRGDSKKFVRRVSAGWEAVAGCRVSIVQQQPA